MIKTMKNLVIGVSPESSLELLESFADVIRLDINSSNSTDDAYDTVYIRSHFSDPSLSPAAYRGEINRLVQNAKNKNSRVRFIDNMDNIDAILAFEDKWHQYETFGPFMPRTEQYDGAVDISSFVRPIYKHRLSSEGTGVTWDIERAERSNNEWIIQESLDIKEELRIYIIFGEVYPVGAVRRNMTEGQKALAVDFRQLADDEIEFSLNVMKQSPGLDIIGIDVARTLGGTLNLMEVNRSPGFAKFEELTGVNLASILYEKLASELGQRFVIPE